MNRSLTAAVSCPDPLEVHGEALHPTGLGSASEMYTRDSMPLKEIREPIINREALSRLALDLVMHFPVHARHLFTLQTVSCAALSISQTRKKITEDENHRVAGAKEQTGELLSALALFSQLTVM